jgi:hypothetical protein
MKRCIPVLMLAVLAVVGTAWGQLGTGSLGTVDFNLSVNSSNATAYVYANGQNGSTVDGYLGPYTYQFTSVTADHTGGALTSAVQGLTTNGFCVDLVDEIGQQGYSAYVYSLTSSASVSPYALQNISGGTSNNGLAVAHLQELAGEYVKAAGAGALLNPQAGILSYALQYAIWDVVTVPRPPAGSNYNLATSPFLVSDSLGDALTSNTAAPGTAGATAVTIANYWLAHMGDSSVVPFTSLYSLVPTNGDQIQSVVLDLGSFTPQTGNPVPEPVGLVGLVGLALCGLPIGANVLYRRFRRV